MARTKAVLGAGARLSDYLSARLLARVYAPELVFQALDRHGVGSQRTRSLPAPVTSYYCMALSLYPEAAYEEGCSVVAQGLARLQGSQAVESVAKSSISAARSKIGYAPLQSIHETACVALPQPDTQPHAFYAGLRLVAIDGSNFEIPDEAANVAVFGRPGSRTGRAAHPQAQCAVLVECATHAILGANIGAYRCTEWTIFEPLLACLGPDMLCLADRGFRGYPHWKAARDTGAQLLWRGAANQPLSVITPLPDGSYLSAIYPDIKSRRKRSGEIVVRVIEYCLPGVWPKTSPTDAMADPGQAQRYRLLTTLLDPDQAPALELAALYHERWEVEAVFDELKTHLVQRRRTLRSKTPDGVRQEFYGWVLAHYAVCWLMHQAASAHRLQQRQLSFTGHVALGQPLHLLRRAQPRSGGLGQPRPFPPARPRLRRRWYNELLREAATLRCSSSRGRCNPRMVKRRHSSYPSHDPTQLPGTFPDTTPSLLKPQPLSKWFIYAKIT